MDYRVQPGDSLSSIATKVLGDETRWAEIARTNGITTPDRLLVGQLLRMPMTGRAANHTVQAAPTRPAWVPASFHLFVLADEVNPLRGKVVRRVLVNPRMTADAAARLGRPLPVFPHPERFGFSPSAPGSALPVGRHAMGMKPTVPVGFSGPTRRRTSLHRDALLDRRGQGAAGWWDVPRGRRDRR